MDPQASLEPSEPCSDQGMLSFGMQEGVLRVELLVTSASRGTVKAQMNCCGSMCCCAWCLQVNEPS